MIWMFKLVVDEVLVPQDFGPFLWIAAAYVGLTLVAGVLGFSDDYLANWIGERFLLDLRTRFFAHLQGLSLDFFDRRRLGDLISRLTGDIASIEAFVLSGVTDALSYVLRIVFFSAALFYLQWDLALVSLLVAPLFWLAAKRFSRLIKVASREKRRRSGSISSVAEESLSNAALVQAYGQEEAEVERFHRENLGSYNAEMASTRLKALYTPLIDLIELSGALLVIGLGTWELSQGHLTLGGLLVFMTFLTQLYSPVRGTEPAGQPDPRGVGRRGADHRDARPAAVGGRVLDAPLSSGGRRAGSSSTTSPSAIPRPSGTPSRASRSRSSRARCWRWSARAARASRRWRSCCCASTTRISAGSCSTGTDLRD